MSSDPFRDIINDTCELLRQSAKGRNRVVHLSPEVAQQLDARKTPVPPASPQPTGQTAVAVPGAPLASLQAEVTACTKCELSRTRTQTVFGDGSPTAKLVFVGEAPGADEDRQGVPFVGRAGQLLTDIIEKGMKLRRGDVFICNVLKCRPPGNRNPLPSEVEQCEPYLIRQLEALRPAVICALGKYAAQTLLKTNAPIGRLRGRWHFYHGIPLRATYHPAYLLRSPGEKRKTWEDVQEIMKVINGEVVPGQEP
ncbi:MAG: uracil-DNA glycosylase [Nitrospiraceae bacterium]|nr:uracil-DNA glycosylase [Nitrospiraceae bacterium]